MAIPYDTGGGRLAGVFQYLVDLGFYDFFLPAALIFAVVFAVLQKVSLFKAKNAQGQEVADRRINGVLALVIAAMIALPHAVGYYPVDRDPIVLISKFLPQTAVMLVAVLALLFLLGLTGGGMSTPLTWVVAVVSAGVLALLFLSSALPGLLPGIGFLSDPNLQAGLIVLLTMGLIGWWVIRPEGPPLKTTLKDWVGTSRPVPPPAAPAGGGGHGGRGP